MAPAFPHVVASSQQVWKLIEKDYTLRLSLVANGWATEHLKAWNAVFAEGRKRGNSAYYGTALVDMEIADMDKRAQCACDIFGEIWEIQGRKKCRPFFRAVFDQGINPMLSIREGCFRHELELHLKRTGRGLSPDLSAVMGSMKRHTAQLRAKWNTKLEIAARDAESQESLAREQETEIVQGKLSTSSLGSDQFHKETIWTKMRSWGVVGTIDVFVLSIGVAFMTSGHPQATDIFLSAGTLLFVVKFWTWEEARRQPMWKRWRLQVGAMLLSCSVCICALFWNHAINRAAASEQAKPAPPQALPAQPAVPTIDNQPKRSATITDEITALLSEQLQVDKAEIKPEKDLVTDLGATPLDKTEIVMQIETAYNIQISTKDARKLKSVGDIINYMERRDHTGKTSTSVAPLPVAKSPMRSQADR